MMNLKGWNKMKALTLWQPWASLLACGAKKYETRSWATKYRGPIAIHAAARHPNWWKRDTYGNHALETALVHLWGAWGWSSYDELPRGCIIATAELVGCHKIMESALLESYIIINGKRYFPHDDEWLFGNWTPGRYAWEFANMTMLPEPIPAKGHQQLWNWEVHHENQ